MERDFKGVWIPKELYLDENLSWAEKILLVEIDSLDRDDNGCFASNEYLSKFLMLKEGTVANMIIKLIERGYLIKRGFDGRKRYISVNQYFTKTLKQDSQNYESRVHKNMNSESIKILKQDSQKCEHSNTYNNTVNNSFNKDSFSVEKKFKNKAVEIYPTNFTDKMIKASNDFFEYRKQIGKPFKADKSIQTKISQWSQQIDNYGENAVIQSIETAIANQYQGTFIDKQYLTQSQTQNPLIDDKGNYANTDAGRELFISNIRKRAEETFRK
jgi:hypothetical protein